MLLNLRRYFQTQIRETLETPALRFYAFFLIGTQALSLYFMRREALSGLSEVSFSISWPGFPEIFEIRSQAFWIFYLVAWALVLAVAAWGFWRRSAWGYMALMLGFFMKGFLAFQSYRFMGNYHYMPAIMTAIFLFIPHKKQILPIFLVFFYLAAGLLKLNPEWLAGHAVLWGPPKLLLPFGNWIYSFVVFLELVLCWLLLFPQKTLRGIGLFSFTVFHLVSWHWVGYFYPLVMLQLLAIFPLLWWHEPRATINFENPPKAHIFIIVLFWLAQALPYLQKSDSALTGDGRLWSLNMYDANSTCYEQSTLQQGTDIIETTGEIVTAVRTHCEPYIYLDQIKKICRESQNLKKQSTLSFHLISKRQTSPVYKKIISTNDACNADLTYNMWGWNDWLKQ